MKPVASQKIAATIRKVLDGRQKQAPEEDAAASKQADLQDRQRS
jgi:hypothetical protein